MIDNLAIYTTAAAALILVIQGIFQIVQAIKQTSRIDKIELNAEHSLINIEKIVSENKTTRINIDDIRTKVSELYVLHNVRDDSGVPVWYNNSNFIKDLISAVAKLNDSIVNQNALLQKQLIILENQIKK